MQYFLPFTLRILHLISKIKTKIPEISETMAPLV